MVPTANPTITRKGKSTSSRKVRFDSFKGANDSVSALSGVFKLASKKKLGSDSDSEESESESDLGDGKEIPLASDSSSNEEDEDEDLTLVEDAEANKRSGELNELVGNLDKELSSLDIDGKMPAETKLGKDVYSQIKALINHGGPIALAQPSEQEVTKALSAYQSAGEKIGQGIMDLSAYSKEQWGIIEEDLKRLQALEERQRKNREEFEKKVGQIRKSYSQQKVGIEKTFEDEKKKSEPEIQRGQDVRASLERVRSSWKSQLDCF